MNRAPRPPLWRTLLLAVVVAYALADVLLAAAEMDGASADFFPQWVLAHLTATGRRADAYDFTTQAAFIKSLSMPPHWAELLKLSHIKDIGVCPYPPTFALLYAPLGRLSFEQSAMVLYFASVGMALIAAGTIGRSVAGRVSSLMAAFAILYYPGFRDTLHLGQNSLLTLTLWALGWRELVRRRDLAAGLWWGLLAYKFQWLLAVGWIPLVIGRFRILLGVTISTGILASVATALFGPAVWGRWLSQVAALDHVYVYDPAFRENLLFLGCDLRSVSLRYFGSPEFGRIAGWAAIMMVAVTTSIWYRRRPGADPAGPEGPGLLFASGLTVAHLYYYDETAFLLPLLVLWSHRSILTWSQFVILTGLTAGYYAADPALAIWGGPSVGPPLWTLAVVALWIFSLTARTEGSRT
jgi:hypothetical protein